MSTFCRRMFELLKLTVLFVIPFLLYLHLYRNINTLRQQGWKQGCQPVMQQIKACSKTVLEAVSGQDIILNYRCLQILNIEFNSCFAEVLLPLVQFANIFMPAASTFILILLHSQLDALTLTATSFGSILPPVLVILIYPGGAALSTLSDSFLKSLTVTSNRWKRERAYCRP